LSGQQPFLETRRVIVRSAKCIVGDRGKKKMNGKGKRYLTFREMDIL
jgi:hypothetical protein